MINPYSSEYFMKQAIQEAKYAMMEDEIPVGAIVVCKNKIIGRGYNQTERLHDVTAHAEMIAITAASNYLGTKFLDECELYVTLEPCVMCAGAIKWARLDKVYYGASDIKYGFSLINSKVLHPKTEVIGGILEKECSGMITDFFELKRRKN